VLAAQAGVAGSSTLGAGVQVGGQAGVADHCGVGAGARLAAKAGVIGDVPAGTTVGGYPAVERGRWLREQATLARLSRRRPARDGDEERDGERDPDPGARP
jgi:UDP-3-O-[3-hydroxymyristoyl] glucosamine N-acyltransferase